MKLEEFARDFREDVFAYAEVDGNFSRSAFVESCARRLQSPLRETGRGYRGQPPGT